MGKAKRPKSESATAIRVRSTPGVYRRGETFYIRFKDAVAVLAAMRPKDPPPEALVFATSKGTPYTDLPRDWRKARERAGMPTFRFHGTRGMRSRPGWPRMEPT